MFFWRWSIVNAALCGQMIGVFVVVIFVVVEEDPSKIDNSLLASMYECTYVEGIRY